MGESLVAGGMVERECLLFEAGEYPDKGVTVTENDLREIAQNTPPGLPVKVEHLARSPFDGALGTIERLRAEGRQLWGVLVQPVEAWRFVQKAGAKALSVGLDVANRRLLEASFVCAPRVACARVFGAGSGMVEFTSPLGTGEVAVRIGEGRAREGRAGEGRGGLEVMGSVRQFVEGLTAYLRSALPEGEETAGFSREQEALERAKEVLQAERERLREERAERQILLWKREGRIRGSERAGAVAKALLMQGEGNAVTFDGASVPVSALFATFVAENAPLVPMGEILPGERHGPGSGKAQESLIRLAMEEAKRDGCGYVSAFARVSARHPELAREAREE